MRGYISEDYYDKYSGLRYDSKELFFKNINNKYLYDKKIYNLLYETAIELYMIGDKQASEFANEYKYTRSIDELEEKTNNTKNHNKIVNALSQEDFEEVFKK